MVKIRLKRMGTTKRPVYRLVVADSRSPRDGRFIEAIGFYDPLPDPAVVRVDEEKVRVWMRRGARPSDSARQLLVRQGILEPSARARQGSPVASGNGQGDATQLPDTPGSVPEEAVEANPATLIDEASADEGEARGAEKTPAERAADERSAGDAGDGEADGGGEEGA